MSTRGASLRTHRELCECGHDYPSHIPTGLEPATGRFPCRAEGCACEDWPLKELPDFDPIVGAERCPFVQAVKSGQLGEAHRLALAGDDPADESVIPLLVRWATEVA